MKNLTVHRNNYYPLECLALDAAEDRSKVLCTVNCNNNNVYFAVDGELFIVPCGQECTVEPIKVAEGTSLVGLEFCSVTQQLYCICENGDVLTVDVEADVVETELAVQFSEGLRCATLSPDQEILVLITKNDTVVCMVSDFQVISEKSLHSPDFGEKQFVTIGWGKKETQFHGSEGKAAAKLKPVVHAEEREADSCIPRITWRGDGLFFAVTFINNENKTRQFKVFNREGTLQYTSELCNGLDEFLSWKPSGNLIAAAQRLANKYVIALFEKNGLRHREFTLPFQANKVTVRDLFWSPDSDILTIWCEQPNHDSFLQLWTQNNYHWYLKQTITFPVENPLLYATWSTVARSGKELILLTKRKIFTYSFHWTVNQSMGKTVEDKAVVAVIDGNKALLTSFRAGIVPPPMAHQEIKTDAPINAIVFAPAAVNKESWVDSNVFFCVLANDKLAFFQCKADSDRLEYGQIALCEIEIPGDEAKYFLSGTSHFLWYKKDTILCQSAVSDNYLLCVLKINSAKLAEQSYIAIQETHPMDGPIEHIVPSADASTAYIVAGGYVSKYTENIGLAPTSIKLQQLCYQVNAVRIGEKDVILALSHRNCLSVDGEEIANNITSMHVHSDFILLTTLQHTLICTPLNEMGIERLIKQDLSVKPWEDGFNDKSHAVLNVRRAERGSMLITSVSRDSKVILQMPRGNLECIQPRALSLRIIGSCLDNCEYSTAFILMRKERINLNLIYDHNPALFVENAEKFVADIAKPSWLSLFLTELQDEDVTTSVYANCYTNDVVDVDLDVTSKRNAAADKVERLCELLRDIMEKRCDANNYIQPILISLVKSHRKQGLEAALRKVREVKASEESTGSAQCTRAEEALRYLLYLVDVNVLFDTALGMYDFKLAVFVASKSQKDPKEYLPFLNELKKMDDNYMKYSIDVHLKRFESALEHISKENDRFNECMTLVRNHGFYEKGLELFSGDSERYKEIARAYGEHLLNNGRYREAGVMFRKGEDLENSLHAYKQANDWQQTINVAQEMKLGVMEIHSLYRELTVQLTEDKRYEEAARIFMDYLRDPEEAVSALCNANKWKDAIKIARDVRRLDLIETHVQPSVSRHADHLAFRITEDTQNFEKYKSRLTALRHEMTMKKTQPYNDVIDDSDVVRKGGISDMLSEASSVAGSITSFGSRCSTASGKTYRSSKNRRKQERKLLCPKEGSAFEDLGLLRALHEIVMQTYKRTDEVDLVTQMLRQFNDDECAEKLQSSSSEFLCTIRGSIPEIWDETAPTSLSHADQTQADQFKEMLKSIERFSSSWH